MTARTARAALLLPFVAGSCIWLAREPNQEVQETTARVVAATVNSSFTLRLRDHKGSHVTLGPTPNGLRVTNGVVSGRPAQGMVMFVASQRLGLTTGDTTWIVVFSGPLDAPALPQEPYRYRSLSDVPPHLSVPVGRIAQQSPETVARTTNPTTDAGAALGRVLFYDRRLSGNDAVSCASCHLQSLGFGDTARLSLGWKGQKTRRHSMALANVQFTMGRGFFWDLRAKSLEQQVLMPIQDEIEMGMSLPNLQRKLRLVPYYPALYTAAFGTPEITIERTAQALAQFLRTLVTTDAPYDRAFTSGNVADLTRLTTLQRDGFQVFQRSGCFSCHFAHSQIMLTGMNSGLDAVPTDSGAGRGAFRAPSLRNVAIRAPYMHDGRFNSLDEVLDFYDSGVQANENLDPRLRDRATQTPRRLNLTAEQRIALKAFLHALTDSTFLSAPEYSDPFPRSALQARNVPPRPQQ